MDDKKIKILIADDEEGLRFSLAMILEIHGYAVETAADGESAVKTFKNGAFDAVLLDIRMPKMNGVETLKKIRKIKPSVSVIMMTAYADSVLIEEALKEGANACVGKPFEPEEVVGIIKELTDGKNG